MIAIILILIGLALAFWSGVIYSRAKIRKEFRKFAAQQIEWSKKKVKGYTQDDLKEDTKKMSRWSRVQTEHMVWFLAYRHIVDITRTNKRRSTWTQRTELERKSNS